MYQGLARECLLVEWLLLVRFCVLNTDVLMCTMQPVWEMEFTQWGMGWVDMFSSVVECFVCCSVMIVGSCEVSRCCLSWQCKASFVPFIWCFKMSACLACQIVFVVFHYIIYMLNLFWHIFVRFNLFIILLSNFALYFSVKFINYNQNFFHTSKFLLPPEVFLRRMKHHFFVRFLVQ